MKLNSYKPKRNVIGIRSSIYFVSYNRGCYISILELNLEAGEVRSKIMWQNLLQYRWRIRSVCRIKFWLTEHRQLRYRFKGCPVTPSVVKWQWLHKSGSWVYKLVALIDSCERPKLVLVDINYSWPNCVIDSGPKLGVTRKSRTDWEEKGDPLKVQPGGAGHAASVRNEAKGWKRKQGSYKSYNALILCWEN